MSKTPLKQARNKNAIEAAILNRVLDRDWTLNRRGPLSFSLFLLPMWHVHTYHMNEHHLRAIGASLFLICRVANLALIMDASPWLEWNVCGPQKMDLFRRRMDQDGPFLPVLVSRMLNPVRSKALLTWKATDQGNCLKREKTQVVRREKAKRSFRPTESDRKIHPEEKLIWRSLSEQNPLGSWLMPRKAVRSSRELFEKIV